MVWEYKSAINKVSNNVYDQNKTIEFNVEETDLFLNIMGQQQWELIEINPVINNGDTIQLIYFFKRPLFPKPSDLPDIGYDIDNNDIPGSQL